LTVAVVIETIAALSLGRARLGTAHEGRSIDTAFIRTETNTQSGPNSANFTAPFESLVSGAITVIVEIIAQLSHRLAGGTDGGVIVLGAHQSTPAGNLFTIELSRAFTHFAKALEIIRETITIVIDLITALRCGQGRRTLTPTDRWVACLESHTRTDIISVLAIPHLAGFILITGARQCDGEAGQCSSPFLACELGRALIIIATVHTTHALTIEFEASPTWAV